MTTPIRRLTADATGQLGAFNREQAHAAGLSDGQLRRRIQSGILDQPGPHTFRSTLSPRSALGDLVALVVDVGPPCWVSGPTAAALHGFDGFPLRHRSTSLCCAIATCTASAPSSTRDWSSR